MFSWYTRKPGSKGSGGTQGPQGSQGVQYSQAQQGEEGSQGEHGSVGTQGFEGPQGSQGSQGPQGEHGSVGTQGSEGPQGNPGPQGSQGPEGIQGAPCAGTMIPFASGLPVTLTTTAGGLSGTSPLIGFGSSANGVPIKEGNINLTGGTGILMNFAFSVPKSCTITDIAAYFSTTRPLSLVDTTITITAQLYQSTTPNNIFTPIPEAVANLVPGISGSTTLGTVSSGVTSGLNVAVAPGTRLLLVFSAKATGASKISNVEGYASGGINVR